MQHKLGENWLLLRGLSREVSHWGDFITTLQAAFPDADIHTLDLPGTGQYYQQTSPDNIAEITQIVRQNAFAKGYLQKPITLLGLSMGGMVAWEWLQKYSQDLNGAVLINASFGRLSPFYQRLRWQSYIKVANIIRQTNLYQHELAIIKLVSNCRERYEKTALYWHDIQSKRPVSLSNSLKQIIAAANYTPGNNGPEHPVLLLNSRGDRLVAPVCSLAIQNKWQINLDTHPWAGHDLSLDDGFWLADRLKTWSETQSASII